MYLLRHKIERLYSHDYLDNSKRRKSNDNGIIPIEVIQEYIDKKELLGWELVQMIPIYIPINQYGGGANKLFGIDYCWKIKE